VIDKKKLIPLVIAFVLGLYATRALSHLEGYIANKTIHGRIGILCGIIGHKIIHVYRGSPAQLAGLRKGDIITTVNDKDITGPAGTFVTFYVRRGDQTLKFSVLRVRNADIDTRH
jgi:S1-C subfamily serine protease